MPPPSADGAGGIMRQQACFDHFSVQSLLQREQPSPFCLQILQHSSLLLVSSFIHSPAPVIPQLTHCAQLYCSHPPRCCCCCCCASAKRGPSHTAAWLFKKPTSSKCDAPSQQQQHRQGVLTLVCAQRDDHQ